jgi:hypothetical protein
MLPKPSSSWSQSGAQGPAFFFFFLPFLRFLLGVGEAALDGEATDD